MSALPIALPTRFGFPIDPEDCLEPRQLPSWGWWTLNQLGCARTMVQTHHRRDELEAVLVTEGSGTDTYMSQGFFEQPSRRALHLAYATHAYVDLDVHKTVIMANGQGIDTVARMVLQECDDWMIPHPSSIIFSGRGLYLKWFWRHPIPRSAAGRAVAVNRALVGYFKDFGADPAAVDMSRILRVVGSVNSRSGETVQVVWRNEADGIAVTYDFEAFGDQVLPFTNEECRTMREERAARRADIVLLSEAKAKRQRERQRTLEEHRKLGHKPFCREEWHWGVIEDLRRLAALRHGTGIVQVAGAGRNAGLDMFGHIGACQLARVFPAHQLWPEIEAWAQIILPNWYVKGDFARHCSTLLDLARRAAAGERVEHAGRSVSPIWTYSKQRLIELLEITSAEMTHMTRLIDDGEKRRRDRVAWRAAHTGQDRAEYLKANGISRDKPWEAEGVSRATWYRRRKEQDPVANRA